MSEVFLINAIIHDDAKPVRGVSSDGKDWVAIVDLFDLAVRMVGTDQWPRPCRPPITFVANQCRVDAKSLSRPFKSFGIKTGSVNQACQFLAQEGWSAFLVLSGVIEPIALDISEKLASCFDNRRTNPTHPVEQDQTSENHSISQIEALRNRVATLEEAIIRRDERLSRIENAHDRLAMTIRALENRIADSSAGETSRELKAYANRLYARSKQLENEGR